MVSYHEWCDKTCPTAHLNRDKQLFSSGAFFHTCGMAKPETRIEIFLATPGDVIAERTIVFEEVTAWNETHSATKS
jgi:hypothetical protein